MFQDISTRIYLLAITREYPVEAKIFIEWPKIGFYFVRHLYFPDCIAFWDRGGNCLINF